MIRHRKTAMSIVAVFIILAGLAAFIILDKNMRKVCMGNDAEIVKIDEGQNYKLMHINIFDAEYVVDLTWAENTLNYISQKFSSGNKKDLSNCRYC